MESKYPVNGSVTMVVKPSIPGHGFEVGDMVWAKMKSQPWWPGHVYSEEFATPLVRRSKREGLLLVAFFGASSYGWFDPSELVPFDSSYAEKCLQTTSKTFVRAVEDAMVEVNRRIGLGMSCKCRNKQNFTKSDVQGFVVVDVADYGSGAVYSIAAIGKARDSFQPKLALDFLRRLALEPSSSEHVDDIDFIKNKATVMSYRKAVYGHFDELSDLAIQEPSPQETSSKAPLSGMEVFADSLGKVKNTAKLKNRAKKDEYLFKRRDNTAGLIDHAKKDEYLFKQRDDSKEMQKEKEKVASSLRSVKDATGCLEDTPPTVLEFSNPCFERSTGIAESPTSDVAEVDQAKVRPADDENRIVQDVEDRKVITQDDFPSSGPDKIAAFQTVVSGPEKVNSPKCPVEELGSGKTVAPENEKEQTKEGISLAETFSTKRTGQPEGPQRSDGNYDTDISRVLGDLHSLAVDPFNTINRGSRVKVKKSFLRFRSLVFEKSKNFSPSLAHGEPNASKSSEDNVEVPPIKPPSGLKQGLSHRQEEMIVAKKKKVDEIRKLIDEKNIINKSDEHPARDVKQPIASTLNEPVPGPTILILKFPEGGYVPSLTELKARFAHYGPMDHSATQVLKKTFSCQVVFRHKSHAQAAYRFVVRSTSLFGNTDIKCSLKDVGNVGAAKPEPPVKVPEDHHQPAMEDRQPSMVPATSGIHLKSILKTSGGEEAADKDGSEVSADSLDKIIDMIVNTTKPRDQAKKDEYLFKRRVEPSEMRKDKKKVASSPLLVGELGSAKSIMPEKKKQKKEGISLVETLSTKKTGQPEGAQRSNGNYDTGLLRVLDDLHSLAVDPFNTVSSGSRIKDRKTFLRFRSLMFQKGQNFSLPLAGSEPNASKSSEDSVHVPPVKPSSGLKRVLSDRQEETTAAKKKRVCDIKILTKEKKVTKMIDEPAARVVKQPVATTLKKPGPELIKRTEQQAPGPTMLILKFPPGGSLPSYNELKARFVRYGPMDHSGTHIFWNTFSCQVVFRHNVHAQAAYRFVVGSSSLFGNTGVKCTLKEVGTVSSAKPEPAVEVPKEHHLPDMDDRPLCMVRDTSGVQPKSVLKKSGAEEAAGNGGRGRVKFLLGGEESQIRGATSISSQLTKDVSSKNFEKAVHPSVVISPTGSPTPPPSSMHYGIKPSSLPPASSRSLQKTPLRVLHRPPSDPLMKPNKDITQQMLSLLIRCNDVVTNVSSILGYSPYHPL